MGLKTKTVTAITLGLWASAAVSNADSFLAFEYSGYELPEYHADYIKKHGTSPDFAFFGDEDEAFQKLVSGFKSDVTHICAGSVSKWVESGIIEPWDTSRINAYKDLNTSLTGAKTSGEGDFYFLPTDFGSTAVAYLPQHVSADDVGSLNVFKNPAFAGRISIPDNVDDAYALAYLATGVQDWSTVSDAEFEAASNWLREIHPNIRTYWEDAGELAQLMASGEILVSWAWNETPPTMREEGREIGFNREADEGSSLWVCGYVNMKDAPGSEDKAYDYVNAFLSESSVTPLLENGFGSANDTALNKVVTAEDLKDAGLEPISAPILAQLPMSNALREKHNKTFELIKAGF